MQDRRRGLALWVINLSLLVMLTVLIVLLWQALSGDAREGTLTGAVLVREACAQVMI